MGKIKIKDRMMRVTINGNEAYERYRMFVQLSTFNGTGGYNVCMYKNVSKLKAELEPLDEGANKPSEEFLEEFGEILASKTAQAELGRLMTEGSQKQQELLKEYQQGNIDRINALADLELEVIHYAVLESELPEEGLTGADMAILEQVGVLIEDEEELTKEAEMTVA